MKTTIKIASLALALLFTIACEEEGKKQKKIPEETLEVNSWIKDNIEMYYLWEEFIPTDVNYKTETDPFEYFSKILYENDPWSWLTDDYAELEAFYSGVPVTMGYDPSFYLLNDGSSIVMVINYVYPGSPADDAGLKRGDIILSIDDTPLDTENYYILYAGKEYSVELGTFENSGFSYTGQSMDLIAEVTSTDPAIYNTILNVNGKKIGYLVYTEFVAGAASKFLTSLNGIFSNFRSEGISDLIVDFRYNPGGESTAAIHLASSIAPESVVNSQEPMAYKVYNDLLTSDYEAHKSEYPSDHVAFRFNGNVENLDLDRVYFLTTSGTASASELVMVGLDPYMDVVQIGENTHGKYTGAWVIPDDNEQWAMIPIVLKYSNADGFTDFANGLTPDYEITDNLLEAVPFGDLSDPALAKAVELAAGSVIAAASEKSQKIMPFEKVFSKQMKRKQNLFVPVEELHTID